MSPADARVATLILEASVEFSLVALAGVALAALLRRRSAALRHWILASAVACAIVAPVLGAITPAWQIPMNAVVSRVPRVDSGRPLDARSIDVEPTMSPAGRQDDAVGRPSLSAAGAVAIVWAGGAGLHVAVLLAGWHRLVRVRSRARRVTDAAWLEEAGAVSSAYALRRTVLLLQSDHPSLLVTWGLIQPKVILPRAAQTWDRDRIRVVLSHELAHVGRGDWLVQVVAESLRAVHWFNPLAWLLCHQLRQESEQAADDAVLNVGVSGTDYAEHLLDVARAVARDANTWWPAPAIVRPSTLERRITAMLNSHLNRAPLTRPARLLSLLALVAVATVIASAQAALARFSGAVLDPMNRTLPNAAIVLTNVKTQAKHEVRSDSTGRFEFTDLPSGEYELETKLPGFAALRGRVQLSGGNVERTLNLEVGTLQETITVRYTADEAPAPRDPQKERQLETMKRKREQEAQSCAGTPHGGNLRPPAKIVHVSPSYPLHLGQSGVGGTVLMEGVVAKDGTMKEIRVVRSAHTDLDAAAVAAVRQWRFDATLLNCMPIEVTMKVKVDFLAS